MTLDINGTKYALIGRNIACMEPGQPEQILPKDLKEKLRCEIWEMHYSCFRNHYDKPAICIHRHYP
jgi:hypothetical protein